MSISGCRRRESTGTDTCKRRLVLLLLKQQLSQLPLKTHRSHRFGANLELQGRARLGSTAALGLWWPSSAYLRAEQEDQFDTRRQPGDKPAALLQAGMSRLTGEIARCLADAESGIKGLSARDLCNLRATCKELHKELTGNMPPSLHYELAKDDCPSWAPTQWHAADQVPLEPAKPQKLARST